MVVYAPSFFRRQPNPLLKNQTIPYNLSISNNKGNLYHLNEFRLNLFNLLLSFEWTGLQLLGLQAHALTPHLYKAGIELWSLSWLDKRSANWVPCSARLLCMASCVVGRPPAHFVAEAAPGVLISWLPLLRAELEEWGATPCSHFVLIEVSRMLSRDCPSFFYREVMKEPFLWVPISGGIHYLSGFASQVKILKWPANLNFPCLLAK